MTGSMQAGMAGFTSNFVTSNAEINRIGHILKRPAMTSIAGELGIQVIFIGINVNFTQVIAVATTTIKRHRRLIMFNMTQTVVVDMG